MWIGNKLTNIDLYGAVPSFKINKGSKSLQTLFGGIVSLLIILLTFSAYIYFLNIFFKRKDYTLVTNSKITNQVSLENYHEIPFMVRLSDAGTKVLKNPEKYWKIEYKYWYVNETKSIGKPSLEQDYEDILMETCDINNPIHFNPKYKKLFEQYNDIDTFQCPTYHRNITITGLYGDAVPYTHLHFYFRGCNNKTDGNCEEKQKVDKFLDQTFIDFRTISNNIETDAIKPSSHFVYGERLNLSKSLFKKIFMKFRQVRFNSDFSYIFQEFQSEKFFHIHEYENEVDLRDYNNGIVPGSFCWMYLINYKETITYHRSFMKAQTLLANLGGITKGLLYIGAFLNWVFTQKLLNIYLINSFPVIKYKAFYNQKNMLNSSNLFYIKDNLQKQTNDSKSSSVKISKRTNELDIISQSNSANKIELADLKNPTLTASDNRNALNVTKTKNKKNPSYPNNK